MPVIAAVNGFALGGGCELALACDFIYASRTAKFGQPEVKPGRHPRLRRHAAAGAAGRASARARELVYTGAIIDADEALRIGLVQRGRRARRADAAGARAGRRRSPRNGPLAVAGGQARRCAGRARGPATARRGAARSSASSSPALFATARPEGRHAGVPREAAAQLQVREGDMNFDLADRAEAGPATRRATSATREVAAGGRRDRSRAPLPAEIVARMAELGLLGHRGARGVGRRRHGHRLATRWRWRRSRARCASTGVIMCVNNSLVCDPILHVGTDAQSARWLPAGGGQAARLLRALRARGRLRRGGAADARRRSADGDGWVLNGTKNLITNGPVADVWCVFAMTDPAQGQPRHHRVHRADGRARASGRPARRQARHPRRAVGADLPRRLRASATTRCSARWATASRSRCARSTAGASASRRRRSASRAPRSRTRPATRRSARRSASRSPSTRRSSSSSPTWHRDRRRAPAALARRGARRTAAGATAREAAMAKLFALRGRQPRRQGGDPDLRRLRLRDRVPGRAALPRREDHRDLRGHQRDPAPGDRFGLAQGVSLALSFRIPTRGGTSPWADIRR